MKVSESYKKRSVRYLQLLKIANWSIKFYGIKYGGGSVDDAIIESALIALKTQLGESSGKTDHYFAGFACVHQGRGGNFAFIDWWADENELHHHLFVSNSTSPCEFEYKTPTGLVACTSDLALLAFEREAWVQFVLANSKGPDLDGYLQHHMNQDV